jgi:DNA gyrase/topoisomerase IV subunit B
MSSVEEIGEAGDAIGEATDYVLEAMLEQAVVNLGDFMGVADRVATYWLQIEAVPGGTHYEVVVRSAEFLAAYHQARGVSHEELSRWAASEDWRQRLVCAWTVRDDDREAAAQIRDKLATDPFQDDNYFYLVREGAGVYPDLGG